MVKSLTQKQQQINENNEASSSFSSSCKFKGVRKRKWGKYVSEIRLPNSRERIWLGSYDTAEKAARAFDAALYCLRGGTAKFNFPDNPPEIVNGRSLTPAEIQVAAARFANNSETRVNSSGSGPGRVENLDQENHSSSLSSSCELHVESPSPSVSDGGVLHLDSEITETPLDNGFLDSFSTMGSLNNNYNNNNYNYINYNENNNDNNNNNNNNFADYGIFPGFDDFSGDFYVPPLPSVDYGDENWNDFSSGGSFLWNF